MFSQQTRTIKLYKYFNVFKSKTIVILRKRSWLESGVQSFQIGISFLQFTTITNSKISVETNPLPFFYRFMWYMWRILPYLTNLFTFTILPYNLQIEIFKYIHLTRLYILLDRYVFGDRVPTISMEIWKPTT